MRERPILFNAEMVRAVLSGAKTQTRRVVKTVQLRGDHVGVRVVGSYPHVVELTDEGLMWRPTGGMPAPVPYPTPERCSPYGVPGDRLWVREAYAIDDYRYLPGCGSLRERPADLDPRSLYYRADGDCCAQIPECQCQSGVGGRRARFWRSARYMPRWASRILLEVTDVRIERVQDISEADARAEGTSLTAIAGTVNGQPAELHPMSHKQAFGWLWDSINEKRGLGWNANPWVWIVEFERVPS